MTSMGRLVYKTLLYRLVPLPACLVKLLLHRRVHVGELADGQVLRIFVGQAEVVLRAQQAIFYFLELGYRVVNLLDGLAEFPGSGKPARNAARICS